MPATSDQIARARRTMRRQIMMNWLLAAVLVVIAATRSMPLWLRFVITSVGLLQVGMVFVWRFARRRMNMVSPRVAS